MALIELLEAGGNEDLERDSRQERDVYEAIHRDLEKHFKNRSRKG